MRIIPIPEDTMTRKQTSEPNVTTPHARGRKAILAGFDLYPECFTILDSVASVIMGDKTNGDELIRNTITKMATAAADDEIAGKVGIDFLGKLAAVMTRDGLQARQAKDKDSAIHRK
jgi:hypothetical protein